MAVMATRVEPRAVLPFPVMPAIAVVALVILLWIPFGAFDLVSRDAVIWGTAAALLGLAAVAYVSARRTGASAWRDPVFLMTAYFGYKYGFGALALHYWAALSWVETPGIQTVFERWGTWDHLPLACHLFLLAGLGLYLGTALPSGRLGDVIPGLRWRIDERRFRMNLCIYSPIALLFFVVGRRFLPLVIRDTVLLFGWLSWVILIIAAARVFSPGRGNRAPWAGIIVMVVGAHVALGFEIGMRGAFVYPLLLVGLGFLLARGRVPIVTTALATIVLIVIVVPWLTYYKIQPQELGVSDRLAAASDEFVAGGTRGAIERGVEALVGRSVGSAGMAPVFIQFFPSLYTFEYGHTFIIQATHLVPRVIWPDKPNMSEQLNAYTRRTGMIAADDEATSAVFDAVTEYYVNFGVWGVFFLCLVQGYYFRLLHRWLVVRSAFLIGPPIFMVLLFINFDFFGVAQSLLSHTRQLPVWIAVLYLLSRDQRPKFQTTADA
jgi:hypothetical protein